MLSKPRIQESKVGIVIVNWQKPELTIQCINSLFKSRYKNFSVVVVDNNSGDNSVSLIENRFPFIKIIESERNKGFGYGNNIGIKQCLDENCQYIWLLNNDTISEDITLENLVEIMEKDLYLGALGCVLYTDISKRCIQSWGGGEVNPFTGLSHHYLQRTRLSRWSYLTAASVMLRSEVFKTVDGFDERFFMYWEDVDLMLRIRRSGWGLKVCETAEVVHFESSSLGRKSKQTKNYFYESSLIFYRKHLRFPYLAMLVSSFRFYVGEFLRGKP